MPPKPKFDRDEIIAAAIEIVREQGTDALTTRNIGQRLGSSARPIFTVFKNMEELTKEVRAAALKMYESYVVDREGNMPPFKQAGMRMLTFSLNEPKLYQLLFMHENKDAVTFDDVRGLLGETADYCMEVLTAEYGLNRNVANRLFENVWIYTYGIASLCATGMCRFSERQLSEMLTVEFTAMLRYVMSENKNE